MILKDLPFSDVFAIREYAEGRVRYNFRMAVLNPSEASAFDDVAKQWLEKKHEAEMEMLYRFNIPLGFTTSDLGKSGKN